MVNEKFLKLRAVEGSTGESGVVDAFTKTFDFNLITKLGTDAYTEHCLFEFKYDRTMATLDGKARTLAQALYYCHRFYKEGELIPEYICIASKKGACLFESHFFETIYTSENMNNEFIWTGEPSNPNELLVNRLKTISEVNETYTYNYFEDADLIEFCEDLSRILNGRGRVSKQHITPRNIEKVWTIWSNHFEEYVRNDRKHKPTFYFYVDIQENRTYVVEESGKNSRICFVFDNENGDSKIVQIPTVEYQNFWNRFKKLEDRNIIESILQKIYRLENTDVKKFQGMFYTPRELARNGLAYLEDALGQEFWKDGEWRIWDMCAGTGNLEYDFPEDLIQKCYLSTLENDEVRYCKDLFPTAKAIFQYDYLNDDVDALKVSLIQEFDQHKLPSILQDDLKNPNIKWLIFINPPYAEASENKASGVKRKTGVNDSKICEWMKDAGHGKAGHELYFQFLFRIFQEFPLSQTILAMFSTPKYINGTYGESLRNSVFHGEYLGGFVMNSKKFSQCKGKFPICFAIWDLASDMLIQNQDIVFDIYDNVLTGTKHFTDPEKTINEWFVREKNTRIFVPFSSAITEKAQTSNDVRDRVYEDFLGYLASGSPDVQNNNFTCIMSTPTGGHIGTSINEKNIEKAFVINAVRNLIVSNWLNNKDTNSVPNDNITDEFFKDCMIYSLFSDSNQTASIRNVSYKGQSYNVVNNFFPFKKSDLNISSRFDDSFVSKMIDVNSMSKEAKDVYDAAKLVYKYFFKHIDEFDLTKFRIDKIDYKVGWYQIRKAMQNQNVPEIDSLLKKVRDKVNLLGEKIVPLIYEYGFLSK